MNNVDNKVREHVRDIMNQTWSKASSKLWTRVSKQVRDQVSNQIRNQVSNRVKGRVSNEVRHVFKLERLNMTNYQIKFRDR
jgi:gas vesicle protein